jgi:hypothetical protein
MTIIAIAFAAVVLVFCAGWIVAYAVTGQDAYMKQLRLQVEINTLRARELPPRVLELWTHNEHGAARGVYLRAIDADKVVDALALVAAGTREFSERGLHGVLTRREMAALRNELIKSGYATWSSSDRRQGIIWTADGLNLLETCKNEGVRARACAPGNAKRHPRRGVGEGMSYV